jgi:hypothetical protein
LSRDEIYKNFVVDPSWEDFCLPTEPDDVETTPSVQEQIAQIQNRLEWLEEQRVVDRQEYNARLCKAKRTVRQELFDWYEPILLQIDNSKYEGHLVETSKVIAYLRGDNARLRAQITQLAAKVEQLKKEQKPQLEANLNETWARHEELEDRAHTLEKDQSTLKDDCKIFKVACKNMRAQSQMLTSFSNHVVSTNARYELCLGKILNRVQTSARKLNRINNKTKTLERTKALERDILQITKEGVQKVADGREAHLAMVELVMEDDQERQTPMLKNLDLLFMELKYGN